MDSTANYALSVSAVGMAAITPDDVLRWVYMGLAIISILIPLIVKLIDTIKDGHVSADELNELKDKVDEAKDEIKEIGSHEKNDR